MNYHNFNKLSDILENVAKKSGLNFGISQTALFSMWNEIVGTRFRKNTKPIKIVDKTLYIATKSAVVTQELSLVKNELLKKINILTKNLKINITDIIFNHKIWNDGDNLKKQTPKKEYRKYLPTPTDYDIKKIEIPESMILEIKQSLQNSQNLSDEIKQKITNTIINDIKRQIWKREQNYPICVKCGMVLDYIEEGKIPLCPICSNENQKSSS